MARRLDLLSGRVDTHSMPERPLESRVREVRETAGLSQAELARRVGISRQSLVAIEGGRQAPGTAVALKLAAQLRVPVERLFQLATPGLAVRRAAGGRPVGGRGRERVQLGHVAGHWVAHPLDARATRGADAVQTEAEGDRALVEPLTRLEDLRQCALVAGCAPLLGLLDDRLRDAATGPGVRWIGASSGRAVELLATDSVHVAGLHLAQADAPGTNAAFVRDRLPGRAFHLVHLTRWRQGLVVARGNPLGIAEVADLLRPDLRCARRSPDAGATMLLERELAALGVAGSPIEFGAHARDHADVARLVQSSAVDVGVAIEAAALADDLDFVPLAEERFDLVVPGEHLDHLGVRRLLDALHGAAFRAEVECLPGYDLSGLGWSEPIDRVGMEPLEGGASK